MLAIHEELSCKKRIMIRLLLLISFASFIHTDGVCFIYNRYSCHPCRCVEEHRIKEKYYCNCQHLIPRRDCIDFRNRGYRVSGLYIINPRNKVFIQVFCDQVTDGGGWIVFQRRLDGSVNFYRGWDDYKNGFGAPQHEFWLGNDNLHVLTSYCHFHHCAHAELRVEMKYWVGPKYYAKYSTFRVGDEASKYVLAVSGYSGNAGDSGRGLSR